MFSLMRHVFNCCSYLIFLPPEISQCRYLLKYNGVTACLERNVRSKSSKQNKYLDIPMCMRVDSIERLLLMRQIQYDFLLQYSDDFLKFSCISTGNGIKPKIMYFKFLMTDLLKRWQLFICKLKFIIRTGFKNNKQ